MVSLTAEERARIEAAIAMAETRSSGELVAVVAQAAGSYRAAAILWPALVALAMPGIALTIWPELSAWTLCLAQAALFVILSLVAHLPAVRPLLVPDGVRQRRAGRLARQQFFEQGLHLTRGRTGVLIFVALAEHYVEIIADEGIDAAVPPGTWDKAVARFVERVRSGQVADGFLAIIAEVGGLLAERFPCAPDNANERPDRLVEI